MKYLLILMLFVTESLFANYTKVKTVSGIKIPSGVIAQYDELEELYIVSTKKFYEAEGSGFFGGMGLYNNISMNFITSQDTLKPSIEISLQTLESDENPLIGMKKFIDIDHVDIYIKNDKNIKFSIPIINKQVEKFSTADRSADLLTGSGIAYRNEIREFFKVEDPTFIEYLLSNLNTDSKITMRFKNTNRDEVINVNVKKREITALNKILQLYQEIKTKNTY